VTRAACWALLAALAVCPAANAQWAGVSDKQLSRTAGGEPDLSGKAPRAADGHPDLSGVWSADADPNGSVLTVEHRAFARHFINFLADVKPEESPIQPWAAQLFQERLMERPTSAPGARCKPQGIPLLLAVPSPFEIVQTPSRVLIHYEENTVFRDLFLDGRQPVEDAEPRFMGYSTARWDGDALVVTTRGFRDRHWIDAMGHPNTDKMVLTERYRRRDAGHLEAEVTIDDPGAYTRPITATHTYTLMPDQGLLEYFCADNEKSSEHY
jgi:hypothetical protein